MEERSIAKQAADWVTELKEISAEKSARFGAWLAESPRHVEEFLLVAALEKELEGIDPGREMAMPQVKWAENVIELARQEPLAPAPLPQGERGENKRRSTLAVAAGILTLALGIAWQVTRAPSYATGTGELRSFELEDGSIVHLNTQSRMEVHFSEKARDVDLLAGEALFKVARNLRQPFRVHVGEAMIEAVGTQFNVYRRAAGTDVAVIEGKVRIAGQLLAAGEEARISTNGKILEHSAGNVAQAVAWRERRFVFLDDTLTDVAAEFNRYNTVPKIRVETAAGKTKLSGVFDADDPESLLLFLSDLPNLKSENRGDEVVIRNR